jgi:hypothetical protein
MKNLKKLTFLVTCVIVLFVLFPVNVKAANQSTILPEKWGFLDTGESDKYDFSIDVDSKIYFIFRGYADDWDDDFYGDGTYGDYLLEVYDDSGEIVYTKSGNIAYDDKKITVELEKGDYTLKLTENGNDCFEYLLTIKSEPTGEYHVKKLTLNKTSLNMTVGNSTTLKATYSPDYTTDDISWSSSDKKVVTVSSSGKVTAKCLGTATITCKMGKKTVKCKIVVNKVKIEIIKGKTVNISKYAKNIKNYKKGKYKSSKSKVATISDYKIKGVAHGKSSITINISGQKYTIVTYVYDMKKLESEGTEKLKSLLKNPSSLIVNEIKCENNYLYIDYNAMNSLGGYPRGYFYAWYEDGVLYYMTL